ncbi:MAG: tetratricopeptide repeat protein [Planctomycetota bacterium]
MTDLNDIYREIENSEGESFELVTLAEFERRLRSARPWRVTMAIVTVIGILLLFAFFYLLAFESFWLVTLDIILFCSVIVLATYLYRYSKSRFKLHCPSCNKDLYASFESFKGYIRTKGKYYLDFNPFISGKCMQCKNNIIEVDQNLNRYLQVRNAQIKASKNEFVSSACKFIGLIAFFVIIGANVKSDNDNNQKSDKVDIYSARRQIREGDFEEAKEILTYILTKEPNYSTANEMIGFIYLQEDKLENALDFYSG